MQDVDRIIGHPFSLSACTHKGWNAVRSNVNAGSRTVARLVTRILDPFNFSNPFRQAVPAARVRHFLLIASRIGDADTDSPARIT